MIEQRVLAILQEELSAVIARSVLDRSARALGVEPAELDTHHLPELSRRIEVGVRLFASPERQNELLVRIRALGSVKSAEQVTVRIESEPDVAKARGAARDAASLLGAGSFAVQKIVTAVSELARNIVLYAGSGEIDIVPVDGPKRRVTIVAKDQGPGIADLEHVLSGRYKSKTGLGRGLLSLRRMVDAFDVKSSSTGTVVRVEFVL